MGTTLIVLAHPEQASFNGSWARASAAGAKAAGDDVLWSDLCAMGFDPVEGAGHFPAQPGPFDPLKAHEAAVRADVLPADVTAEVAKIRAADRIVFHFPLWWFAPPAILKGWLDRCLVHGALHDVTRRFDTGVLRGKRALFCMTTGAGAAECGPDGREGDARLQLWPLAHTLHYCGMAVADPLCVHGVHGYLVGAEKVALEARLRGVLDAQADVMAGLEARPVMPFNPDADFGADGRLKPDAPSHSPFIRRS